MTIKGTLTSIFTIASTNERLKLVFTVNALIKLSKPIKFMFNPSELDTTELKLYRKESTNGTRKKKMKPMIHGKANIIPHKAFCCR